MDLPSILVVDDDPGMRSMVSKMLRQRLGLKAMTANSLPDALGAVCKENPDIVITDMRMPRGLEGVALADFVKTKLPETLVILWTDDVEHLPSDCRADLCLDKKADSFPAVLTAIESRMKQ